MGRTPHHPPADSDPRGLKSGNFSHFFAPCGAESWGGGGAPPTTLILLRNQWRCAPVSPSLPAADALRGVSGCRTSQSAKNRILRHFLFFVGSCCFLSRWGEVMLLAARACPRLGLSAQPAHSSCLTTHHCKPFPTRRLKADGPLTTIYVRIDRLFHSLSRLAIAIDNSFYNLCSLRMTSVICFAGDALPQCYVPPIRCKGEWVPVAALLPNASAMFNSMR